MDGRVPIIVGLLITTSLYNLLAAVLYTRREPSYVYPASAVSLGAIWVVASNDEVFTVGAGVAMALVWSLAALRRRSRAREILSYDAEAAGRAVVPLTTAFAISLMVALVAVATASVLDIF